MSNFDSRGEKLKTFNSRRTVEKIIKLTKMIELNNWLDRSKLSKKSKSNKENIEFILLNTFDKTSDSVSFSSISTT